MPATSSRLERRTRILVAALVGATALAACGAGSPTPTESSKSPQQVVHDTAAAIRKVQSFHVSGSMTSGTVTMGMNLRIENPQTFAGSLTVLGATGQVVIVDGASYVSGEDFITKIAGAQVGQLIGDKWARLPAASASSLEADLQSFVDTSKFADCLDSSGASTKLTDAVAMYNGASVIAVTGGDTILEVADQATPYPMRLSVSGSTGLLVSTPTCAPDPSTSSAASTGILNFDHWGNTFTVTAPKTFLTAPSSTPNPTPTATGVPTSFHYTDPQGRWSATFAGPPVYQATTERAANGSSVPYLYAEYASVGVDQLVSVVLIGSNGTFDFTAALNGVATGASGTVIFRSLGRFRGYSSIVGIISSPIGFIEYRMVRIGGVVYSISTLGSKNPPPDFAPFIAGVKLTPH